MQPKKNNEDILLLMERKFDELNTKLAAELKEDLMQEIRNEVTSVLDEFRENNEKMESTVTMLQKQIFELKKQN